MGQIDYVIGEACLAAVRECSLQSAGRRFLLFRNVKAATRLACLPFRASTLDSAKGLFWAWSGRCAYFNAKMNQKSQPSGSGLPYLDVK